MESDTGLALDEPLPLFLAEASSMDIHQRDWMNEYVKRYCDYLYIKQHKGETPSVRDFSQREHVRGKNSPHKMRNLGSQILRTAGIETRKKIEPDFPLRLLTDLGAAKVLRMRAVVHETQFERKNRAHKIGQAMLDKNLLPYDQEAQRVLFMDEIIDD